MIDAEDCGKSVTITDKFRSNEKLLTANSLEQFLELGNYNNELTSSINSEFLGKTFLGLSENDSVYAVLEQDGTEVDEEEYFQLLPETQILMILTREQIWSPNLSLHGSCIFDSSTSIFTTSQLTEALMEHMKVMKATMDVKKEVKKGETQSF